MTTLSTDQTMRSDVNCGALIGRADLSDDIMIDAIKERLASNDRSSDDAETVLGAAMSGDRDALSLLRTINVPAPTVRLTMPTQSLTRGGMRGAFGLPAIRFSWNRG